MIRSLALAGLLAVATGGAAAASTWTVDPAKSAIRFTGSQTGQTFTGAFKRYAATIDLDPAKPEAGHVLVAIDTGSATTGDPQKDEALPGADWFDAAGFPKATFESTALKGLGGNRYEADGTLTIRGVQKPIVMPFTLTVTGGTAHAVGHADLVRTAFGVGQGAWASDEYVAFQVGVDIDLAATAAP